MPLGRTARLRRRHFHLEAATRRTEPSTAMLGPGILALALAGLLIAGCTFNYTPGTAERAGLLSAQLGVSAQGESISLLSQIHVDNVP